MFDLLFPNARVVAFAEPTDDGLLFAAYTPSGRYIQADSPAALAAALIEDRERAASRPALRLAA